MSNMEGAAKDQENHVKFKIEEDELKGHHENLEITEIGHYKYNINLGYLKMDHYYKVSIDLKLKKPHHKLTFLDKVSSKYVTFKEVIVTEPESDPANGSHDSGAIVNHQLVIIFNVHREKLDKEVIYFSIDDDAAKKDHRLELHIEAKVLGVNQGTPLLRNGITLLHHGHQPHASSTRKYSNENIHFNIN